MKLNIQKLMDCPLFKNCREDTIHSLLTILHTQIRQYPKHSYIYHAGDACEHCCIVLQGEVTIEQEDFWGYRNLLAKLQPSDLFGEVFACTKQSLNVDVYCEQPTTVLMIDLPAFLQTSHNTSNDVGKFMQNLLQVLAQKNLYLNAKLTHITKRNTRDKVLSYLSYQAQLQQSNHFQIPFDRQQLADYLSVDRSALSSTLGKLQKDHIIRFQRNNFTLLSNLCENTNK